ncbi:TetR/AcrR family transcriptional regulator C-terminal domain-containing protein [Streptomyces sp. C10-9-1]|uniref:TetR/AcrR family transcriptional regulator n=1 Tax=Streptomyces sp. C10-9-1 TaxID=1859285 RepID=UPI002111EB37|nr:TetR/AcrR family transcriptional regulator C-terminal domain-containing protein [Streptomyces sp. C10-9-1]MCQ6556550.1 TetR/AcrR family transcriptional regulator C-terminal domain-containing protein [Streptomyces sp. C10-9-1]
MHQDPASGAPEHGPRPARRRSDRGRYGRLSRERVLGTALELVDREGLSALSMRRLGAELGVEAMALYRYAEGKEGLLDGLVEAFFTELHARLDAAAPAAAAPAPGAGGEQVTAGADAPGADGAPRWRAELHRMAAGTYRLALDHPQVVPLLATRMLAVPLARRPAAVLEQHERVLALLREAGLDGADSAAAFRAYSGWVLGYVLVELRAVVDDPDEPDPAFRLGLHRIPARRLPLLRAAAPSLAERAGPRDLAAGLDALLDRFAPAEH